MRKSSRLWYLKRLFNSLNKNQNKIVAKEGLCNPFEYGIEKLSLWQSFKAQHPFCCNAHLYPICSYQSQKETWTSHESYFCQLKILCERAISSRRYHSFFSKENICQKSCKPYNFPVSIWEILTWILKSKLSQRNCLLKIYLCFHKQCPDLICLKCFACVFL